MTRSETFNVILAQSEGLDIIHMKILKITEKIHFVKESIPYKQNGRHTDPEKD
jgi:hypothetical protein